MTKFSTSKNLTRKWLLAALSGAAGTFVVAGGVELPAAHAQSSTTGAVKGIVKDENGAPLEGVVVTASSPALQGTESGYTEANGSFRIGSLPPGDYTITFFYGTSEIRKTGINVGIQKTVSVFQTIDTGNAAEIITVESTGSLIDTTKTDLGITLDTEYLKNIPVPGRDFESALGAAAGSQGDGLGVAFSGSSSLENQYYVDGVNTTGLQFGTVGSPVLNNFLEEIEVVTGGYNAEFGRATGGIVQAVTKSGGNEFKGSVYGYYRDSRMIAGVERTPIQGSSIEGTSNLTYETDFGFELGGPIIKDRLWFYVGFGPQFTKVTTTRRTKSRTDCRETLDDGTLSACDATAHQDGAPDQDPATGFYITDDIEGGSREVASTSTAASILAKLNFNITPEHSGQISFIGSPTTGINRGIYGTPDATSYDYSQLTTDVALKWNSKFNNDRTEVEAVLGWHRSATQADALNNDYNSKMAQVILFQNLGVLSGVEGTSSATNQGFGGESAATRAKCFDGNMDAANPDPYLLIENCPDEGYGYSVGGPGGITDDAEQRRSARVTVTHHVPKLLGSHEFKVGGDFEDNRLTSVRVLSGGGAITNYANKRNIDYIRVSRWVQLAPPNTPTTGRFDNTCRNDGTDYQCDFLGGEIGSPGTDVEGRTINWSAFLQDSWAIKPNLTFNAGLRYEEQRLRYAKDLQNTVDPLTGEALGKNAMTLQGMFAPRLGVVYDWTKVAKGKIYGHWGRFYESVPMQINDRSFGGEVFDYGDFTSAGPQNQCGAVDERIGAPNGENCIIDPQAVPGSNERLLGTSGVLVAPGTKAQYLDEIIGGVEYEILPDLRLTVSYQNRRLGRVVEDVSTDGANTYIIANPGEWSADEEANLEARIEQTDDEDEKARLENQLELFRGIRVFDKPRRDYNALQFTMSRRFSKNFYVQGSYTYSKTQGNYPGLVSYDNGQVDPNISSQYDLIELLANRDGKLSQDRPHYIKLDGYYTWDLKRAGAITLGSRIRALSGVPENTLAPHYAYGPDESFLLPRGQLGRTAFDYGVDLHIGYERDLGRGMKLSVFTDLYNVFNKQGEAAVDDTYAIAYPGNNANPVSGGTYEDLLWVKKVDDRGLETADPIERNPNFHNTTSRYSPFYARIGAQLSF